MRTSKMIGCATAAALLTLSACSDKTDKTTSNTTTTTSTSVTTTDAAPTPKPGLWKMTVAAEGMTPMVMNVCLGAPTPGVNPFTPPAAPGQNCTKNDISRSGSGYAIDMECTANGVTMAIEGSVSGNFSTSYRTELTTKMSGANIPPAASKAVKSSVDSVYVSACPEGMKPGQTKQGA